MNGCQQTGLRRALSWIAAYALALQTLLGSFGLIQTTAAAAAFDPLAVICASGNHGAGDQLPGNGHRHTGCDCGCFLGSPAFVEPPDAVPLVFVALRASQIIWPTADWRKRCAARHPSQPPRGPPLPA